MLNVSGKSGPPPLILHLRGKAFRLSHLTMMLAVGFFYIWLLLC